MIEVKHLTVGYRRQAVVEDVTLSFHPGEVLALVGPNGCGKSTLLRSILGLQAPLSGTITFDGAEGLTQRDIARKAAFLPQSRNVPAITARRLVLHGRFPYLSYPRRYGPEDYAAADSALARVGALALGNRDLSTLSGGQRQKIYLAMALAQGTDTIFMDEPTTHLDLPSQMEVMTLARQLAREGKAVAAVLHDLPLALQAAHRIALVAQGRLQLVGTPEEVFASGQLDAALGVTLGRIPTDRGWQYYYEQRME